MLRSCKTHWSGFFSLNPEVAGWEHLRPVGRGAWRLDSILWLYLWSGMFINLACLFIKMKNANCSVAKTETVACHPLQGEVVAWPLVSSHL